MPSTKTVWGIDVGQCALKALKVQWREDRLRVLGFDVIEHGKILSQPDADEQALIRAALEKFANRNQVKGSTVVISVPGQASFTRFIKLPPVEPRRIPEIVRYEARQQIPFDLNEVVWDYQIISPPSAGPREVEVGLFAMKRDIVADYVSDFTAMRIEPDAVQMAPVALYNFLRWEQGDEAVGTLLIDVGAENTNLVIADGERVWIRSIPIGGNNFTNALCREFKLQFSKAEHLKRHAAESKHARQIFQAMRPVFGDLLTEIQRSVGYYTSLHRDSRLERVVALGNAFRLPGLAKFLSQNLGVEVEKIERFQRLGESEVTQAPQFRENILTFGVAYGLAIQGVGVAKISTSLIPPEVLSQKVMRKKRPFFIAAGAALVAAVGAFAYDQVSAYSELSGTAGEVEALRRTVDDIRQTNGRLQGRFEEQKKALAEIQAKIDELENLVRDRDYAYRIWRALWNAWPYDKRWAQYDPFEDKPLRSSLDIIEALDITMHYVPDVRVYSQQARGGTVPEDITVVGFEPVPAEGEEQGAGRGRRAGRGRGRPVPGVVVEITGITPKTGLDGQRFVHDRLIAALKKCKRTVRLHTPAGVEVLASVPLTGLFSSRREFEEFYGEPRRSKAEKEAAEKVEPKVNRKNDLWFKAVWVLHLNPLSAGQKKEIFRAIATLAREAGLASPDRIDPTRVQGDEGQRLAGIEEQLKELAEAWLVSRRTLTEVAIEGVTQGWPTEAVAAADQPPQP